MLTFVYPIAFCASVRHISVSVLSLRIQANIQGRLSPSTGSPRRGTRFKLYDAASAALAVRIIGSFTSSTTCHILLPADIAGHTTNLMVSIAGNR